MQFFCKSCTTTTTTPPLTHITTTTPYTHSHTKIFTKMTEKVSKMLCLTRQKTLGADEHLGNDYAKILIVLTDILMRFRAKLEENLLSTPLSGGKRPKNLLDPKFLSNFSTSAIIKKISSTTTHTPISDGVGV
jgi:hypothetical protein